MKNAIRCIPCNEVIESTHRHDFRQCKGGHVAVDGGDAFLRRVGSRKDYEELSHERLAKDAADLERWRRRFAEEP
jgi:hypothetical protein